MYLNRKINSPKYAGSGPLALHNLTREFLFLSQNARTRHAAESCIDVLRAANALLGYDCYSWQNTDASHSTFQDMKCSSSHTLVLSGGIFEPWVLDAAERTAARECLRNAARVCTIGSAVFVPLNAGILKTQKVAVHSQFRKAVLENGYVSDFVEETRYHSSSLSSAISPAAAIEMMIDIVRELDGEFIANALRAQLGLSNENLDVRSREHCHFKRLAEGHPVVGEALDIMLDHLEDTLTMGQIAEIMCVSPRRLERSFGEKLNQSPLQVYRSLRLEQAEQLLKQTDLPISEISIACGFSNVTLLSKWYTQKFGMQPSIARKSAYRGKCAA